MNTRTLRRTLAGLLAVAALAFALAACGASSDCMILANGGNKVCGADAADWCRATDALRTASNLPSLQDTQATCDTFEQNYP